VTTERALSTTGRLFAIGDIHGCSTALQALIEAVQPRPDDTIIVLGDFKMPRIPGTFSPGPAAGPSVSADGP
jgi:hypothetical protein